MNHLESVLELIVSKIKCYKRSYDLKLFILSMSNIIMNMSLKAEIVVKLFDALISLLK